MPIVHVHIARSHEPVVVQRLLTRLSHEYSRILDSPIERVRAFAVRYDAADLAVAGVGLTELPNDARGGHEAPYFTALVLAGRPREQAAELLARFTDIVADELGAPRERIRGRIEEVEPELWGIGGVSAAHVRRAEIEARRT